MTQLLYRFEMPHFVAGVIVDGEDQIVAYAPILGRFRGQSVRQLQAWIHRRGGTYLLLGCARESEEKR